MSTNRTPVEVMGEALGVGHSGYYAWASRAERARAAADRALAAEIRVVHAAAAAARGCMPNGAPVAAGSAASASRA